MSDYFEAADFKARIKAGAVDFGVPILLWLLLAKIDFPFLGILLCSTYILLRDSLDGQSLGKRWQGLCVINIDTQRPATWIDSIMRNLFVFLPLVGPPWAIFELYYASKDNEFRRIGDRFANTMVVSIAGASVQSAGSAESEVKNLDIEESELGG